MTSKQHLARQALMHLLENRRRSGSPIRLIFLLSAALLLGGCGISGNDGPDLKVLYEEAAQYHAPDRNPVIVIPGILGSKLFDDDSGRIVWGAFDPESVNPSRPDDARLISLPVDEKTPLNELQDHVRSDGVLEKVHVELLGIPIDIRAYIGILSTLGVGGYRDESLGLNAIDYGEDHFTCFQFDYDWRRDNVENAKRLKAFMEEKRANIQAEYKERYGIKDAEVKFDVVAHSMGGVMLRYFLRYGDADLPASGEPDITWIGADYVDRAIVVAAPNGGSALAMQQLVEGYSPGRPLLPHYDSGLLGTFPSIYQLLPRARHQAYVFDGDPAQPIEDIYDPALWEIYEWGLASRSEDNLEFLQVVLPDVAEAEDRWRIALALQAEILARAKAFHQAIDSPATAPAGTDLFLVAGDAKDTPSRISVNRETGEIDIMEYGPGDGTVLRSSALLDERVRQEWRPGLVSPITWKSVLFLSSDHLGLTEDPAFTDNVLYWLLEEPRSVPDLQ